MPKSTKMHVADCFLDETLLIKQIRNGDKNAFEYFYIKYHVILYDFIVARLHSSETTEEIIQNIFLNVWQRRKFLKPNGNIRAYLYQCARNAINNHIRHEKIKNRYEKEQEVFETNPWTPEKEVLYSELKTLFEKAINELPAKRRQIFLYAFEDSMPRKDIAERLGISIKTVEDHLWKALKNIRHSISEYVVV